MTMDYNADAKMLRDGPVDDENLRYSPPPPHPPLHASWS